MPEIAIETRGVNLWYGLFQALYDVDLDIKGIMLLAIVDLIILATLVLEGRRLEHPRDTDRRTAAASS